jgi:Tfp pilus assembly protein PilE
MNPGGGWGVFFLEGSAMNKLAMSVVIVGLLAAAAAPAAWACDPAYLRAARDEARAAQAQVRSSERQERLLRDQNKLLSQQLRAQR